MISKQQQRALEDRFSQELWLSCDPSGKVTWVDARATRLLGLDVGQVLAERVPPGSEVKIEGLLADAQRDVGQAWEVPVLRGEEAVTVSFQGVLREGEVQLLGRLIPEQVSAALRQVGDAMDDVVSLNREIVRQKKELERRHAEVLRPNNELEDSHHGVLTLHAELEEKAVALRHAADVRGRVVANVSHEFRTPLHTVLGLSRLLLEERDGALGDEQRKQVQFIRTAAEELTAMVNDLLDLSKLDSGRMALRADLFSAEDFVAALRGMLKPLQPSDTQVQLVFEEPPAGLQLETDRAKLSQILRNMVSNALKFTERGQVTVTVTDLQNTVRFEVRDTGIGIADSDLERVFEEFTQIDSAVQARVKGTGLGLPLSRKFAELLGGKLTAHSVLGRGSSFVLELPRVLPEAKELTEITEKSRELAIPGQAPVLVVEDDRKTIFIYAKYLAMAGFPVLPARSVKEAREALKAVRPAAVVLDIILEGEATWSFLSELKGDPATQDIPVLVVTVSNQAQKARALGADEFWLKPINGERLLRRLKTLTPSGKPMPPVLVIDDDERSRYLMRQLMAGSPYTLLEAANGKDGVRLAQESQPGVIFLDFQLRGETAFDVLDDLKANPRTRAIPVIISTSHRLDDVQREQLAKVTETLISKEHLTSELAISRIRDALEKAGLRQTARTP